MNQIRYEDGTVFISAIRRTVNIVMNLKVSQKAVSKLAERLIASEEWPSSTELLVGGTQQVLSN